MRTILAPIAFSIAALAIASPASAATYVFASPLEPEAMGATGTGNVQAVFDTTARTLGIEAGWSGLSGMTTVAHIHCCVASPGTAGVAVTPGTLPAFPVGLSSGSYSMVLDLSQSTTYTAGFLAGPGGGTIEGAQDALLAGLQSQTAYFNIHSTTYPGGEIRGFLTAVPEPQSWAMMLMGFGLVGGVLRGRRRQARRMEPGQAQPGIA